VRRSAPAALFERLRGFAQGLRERRGLARVPTILQMEAVECGAASLAMVLAYHGCRVPLEELRQQCGVSRDGTKASNILKAAQRYGLAAKGFRKEPEQLEELPLPSIIHWNFNHFVVFEGIAGGQAWLNDPAIGPRRVPLAELSECFTGVVLAMEPTEEFEPRSAPSELGRELLHKLRGSRDGLVLVLLASLLLVVPGVVTPLFAKIFVDGVLVEHLGGWLQPLCLGMAATAAVQGGLLWLRRRQLLRLEGRLAVAMGGGFLWQVLRLPVSFFQQRHAGDVASRIAANDSIAELLSGGLAGAALNLATAALFAVAMLVLNPLLAALAIPLSLLNVAALRLVRRRREDAARRVFKEQGQLAAATLGTLRAIETLKAGGLEQDAFRRWAGHHAKALAASRDFDRSSAFVGVVPPLLAALGTALLLSLGSLQVMRGHISVGDLVAFLALAAAFAAPIGQMALLGGNLVRVEAALARINDVLRYPREAREEAAADAGAARLRGEVEFRGISFGYNPNEPPLIQDFNLMVKPGSRVALVGASGSGKSTLGKLLCGLYSPDAGQILLDGRPAHEVPAAQLANSLAYVDQEVFLFAASVRDNVTLWDAGVDDARLLRALKDAAIFEDIAVRPGRQDHQVAEGGVNFSGGQRQRLEIARALVSEPSILVLDEATAALDPVVEQQIDRNIRRRGCTTLIIAHRLSTIRDSDEIVMLSGGRVIGRGSHESLLDGCPEYARMVQAQ
jgi:NHLM bacteriocin system ABC transporter peptidase/ATP-binding protein